MTDDLKPSDHLYYALSALKGWDELLWKAQNEFGTRRRPVGMLVSSLLLATDDGATVIAICGELDGDGGGYAALITETGLVHVEARKVTDVDADFAIHLHGFEDVGSLEVDSMHNYFDGLSRYPRHHRMTFTVTVASKTITFRRSVKGTTLTTDDAVLRAFTKVREATQPESHGAGD